MSGAALNRRIVLARRPQGAPVAADFRLETLPVPVAGPGQVLLRTRLLSLDPYMRGRMSEGPSYAPPVAIGAPMTGQTVSVVEASNVPEFARGDLVLANVGWQDYALSDGRDLLKLDPGLAPPSWALGVLGMPGLTAYVGLLDIGQPRAGETVVVAAATGAVGSVVGQIAKIRGAGSSASPAAPTSAATRSRASASMRASITAPRSSRRGWPRRARSGIDVYFESVGGAVLHRGGAAAQRPGARAAVRADRLVQPREAPARSRPHARAAVRGAALAHQDPGIHHFRSLRSLAGVPRRT